MKAIKILTVGLIVALLAVTGSFAGTDLNEVGALLVYPMVAAFELDKANQDPTTVANSDIQTILTITNAGGEDVVAHVSFIDGQSMRGNPVTTYPEANPHYCYECDFFVPLTPNDTETMVVKYADSDLDSWELAVDIVSVDTLIAHSCEFGFGMVIVTLEDEDGNTLQSNVLLGEAIIVDQQNSWPTRCRRSRSRARTWATATAGTASTTPSTASCRASSPPTSSLGRGSQWPDRRPGTVHAGLRASASADRGLLGDRFRRRREPVLAFDHLRLLGDVLARGHQP